MAQLLLALHPATLRPLNLTLRPLNSTLNALLPVCTLQLSPPTSSLPLLCSTLLPLARASTRHDKEKSGDESLYPSETLGALTLSASGYFASSG